MSAQHGVAGIDSAVAAADSNDGDPCQVRKAVPNHDWHQGKIAQAQPRRSDEPDRSDGLYRNNAVNGDGGPVMKQRA